MEVPEVPQIGWNASWFSSLGWFLVVRHFQLPRSHWSNQDRLVKSVGVADAGPVTFRGILLTLTDVGPNFPQ
ncbi:hypothetical protein I552_9151 [Mycobacterium xenopi 3993]|nr:hypothetical protein I552_9151 [Mycobacterium xenopi 3993]